MMNYQTTATVRLSDQKLRFKLSERQAADRAHLLDANDDGTFCCKEGKALEFKAGELIGIDGDLPKVSGDKLAPVTDAAGSPSFPAAGDAASKPKKGRAAGDSL